MMRKNLMLGSSTPKVEGTQQPRYVAGLRPASVVGQWLVSITQYRLKPNGLQLRQGPQFTTRTQFLLVPRHHGYGVAKAIYDGLSVSKVLAKGTFEGWGSGRRSKTAVYDPKPRQ